MPHAARAHDALLPRAPGGNGPGAVLALLVHGALLAALTTAVDWRTHTPDVVSAELWASVPQVAAPKAEEPPPTAAATPAPTPTPPRPVPQAAPQPTEADIAIERAERRKAEVERKKAEAEVAAERRRIDAENRKAEADRKKREQDQRQAKADEARLARQREENLRRMMGQAGGATGGTGTAAQSAAPSAAYLGQLGALIRRNSVFTGTVPGNPAAEVEVRAAPNGTVIARRLIKSSGHKEWDDAVLRAIDRAGTLPRDVDGRVPPTLIVAFRPNE